MISGLKFVSVPTHDPARAVAFWTQKFGFTVAREQPFDDSQQWIELRIPGADTRLVLVSPSGADVLVGGFTNVAFTALDLDRTYDELRTKGVEFVGPVRRADWGASVTFKDAEGNTFLLASP